MKHAVLASLYQSIVASDGLDGPHARREHLPGCPRYLSLVYIPAYRLSREPCRCLCPSCVSPLLCSRSPRRCSGAQPLSLRSGQSGPDRRYCSRSANMKLTARRSAMGMLRCATGRTAMSLLWARTIRTRQAATLLPVRLSYSSHCRS